MLPWMPGVHCVGDDEGSNQKQEEEQQRKTRFDEPGPHKLLGEAWSVG